MSGATLEQPPELPNDLFAALSCPAFYIGTDGAVRAWSRGAARAYGFEAPQALGRPPPMLDEAARTALLAEVARARGPGEEGVVEVAFRGRDGAEGSARFRVASLEAGGAVIVDCAEAERAAAARTEATRERSQAILDAIPAPIWFKDADGVYRECNAEFERYLGLDRSRILGGTVFDVAPPDLAKVYRTADLALFRSGDVQVYESQVQWADGSRREVIFRKAAIRDARGEVCGLAGAMLDVTDLRATERKLRARLGQQAALTWLAADAVAEEDPRRLLQAAIELAVASQGGEGGAVLELSGDPGREELRVAASVGEGYAPRPLAADPLAARVLESGSPLVATTADAPEIGAALGALGANSLAAVIVGAREAPLGVLHVWRRGPERFSEEDVRALEATAHVLAIALERGRAVHAARLAHERLARAERLASIGTLAAGVAHEINNPLTFVLSNVAFVASGLRRLRGLASDAPEWDEVLHALDDAAEGAERMAAIARDLRTLGRNDDTPDAAVEVRRVVEYAASLASSEVRQRARLTWDLTNVPPVAGNEARLGQVLVNLLVNAAHAIPEGTPDLHEIRVSARRDGDERVAVSVSDTGAGIPAEVLPRIFDPFFTTKAPGVGTGLGLWVCHGIVTALGGSIDVESAPGAGTTFRVLLPVARHDPARPVRDGRGGRRGRILVVDDEPLVASAVRRHLAAEFAVDAASGPAEALARIRASAPYDAVICDVNMPGGGGVALLDALRTSAPHLARRFLFITGGATPEDAARVVASGAPRLDKPFDGRRLRAAVRGLLAA